MNYRYQVVNAETQISVKFFEAEDEANELAEFMTEYHKEKYEVKEIDN